MQIFLSNQILTDPKAVNNYFWFKVTIPWQAEILTIVLVTKQINLAT